MKTRSAAAAVGSLVLLSAMLIGAVAGFKLLLDYTFKGVSATVAAAIVAAVSTGLLSLATIVLQRRYERRHAVDQEIRQRKVDIYTDLLDHFFEIFGLGEERSQEESDVVIATTVRKLGKMTPALISWSSDEVLVSWSRYRRQFATAAADPLENMLSFENFLLVVRRDLGHSNKGINPGDLLALWINDVDTFLPAQPPS